MKSFEKNGRHFLVLWIQNDPELWCELRDIQKHILIERIVKEKTFKEIAKEMNVLEPRLIMLFDSIVCRIERVMSKDLAKYIRHLNFELVKRGEKPFGIDYICLN